MKTKNSLLTMLAIVMAMTISQAQNYKAPKIDASGKITDKDGKHIGTVTKEGVINDEMGMKVAYVDAEGSLVDAKTGKKLGKAEKNGNFVSAYSKTPDEGWIVSAPMNGTCLVKDKKGNVVAEVHENYKQFGSCAIHCLTNHMDHNKVMDEKKSMDAAYSCPMHPEVTSDKPGKCSKCGMALVKKDK